MSERSDVGSPTGRHARTATDDGGTPADGGPSGPGRTPPPQDRTESRLLSDSGSMATATLISRVTGFLKIAGLSYVLGLATANNSFSIANTLPTIVAELVLGAVLASIVVPTLVRAERDDADGGRLFTRKLLTLSAAVLLLATVVSMVAAPLLTSLYLGADTKANASLTTTWALLLLPQILFYGMSALFGAILNTHGVFGRVAWAPVLNNVVSLLVLGLYLLTPGELSLDPVSLTNPKLLVLGVGTTLGIVVQAAWMVPVLRRAGVDLRPALGFDPRLAQFGGMAVAVIGYVLVSQVGLTVTTRVANDADASGFVLYNLAWVLLQVPYGIIVVSLLTAIMPRLSRSAAAEDQVAVVEDLSLGSRLSVVALVPIITLFTLHGVQLAVALLSYGASTTDNASRLGTTLAASAFGLLPYALVMLQLRVFYARNQAWAPTLLMVGMMAFKIPLSVWRPPGLDDLQVVQWLAAVNSASFVVGALAGGLWLRRLLGPLGLARVLRTAGLVVAATLAGVVVDAVLSFLVIDRIGSGGLTGPVALVQLALHGLIVLGVAFGLMVRLRLPELAGITAALAPRLRRLARRPAAAPPADPGSATAVDAPTTVLPGGPGVAPGVGPGAPDPQQVGPAVGGPATRDTPGGAPTDTPTERFALDEAPTTVLDAVALGVPLPSGAVRAPVAGPLPYPGAAGPGRSRHPVSGVGTSTPPGAAAVDREDGRVDVESGSAAPATPPGSATGSTDDDAGTAGSTTGGRHDPARSGSGRPGHALPDGQSPPLPGRRPVRGPRLVPGAAVAGGRYRLTAEHGGSGDLRFWQARDTMLDRDVALTFVDAEQKALEPTGHLDERPDPAEEGPQAVLSRTLRLGRVDSPGLARVLDVVRGSSGGIVVAEWTQGRSLREVAETEPSPVGAARAVKALAAAAESAHRAGASLGLDHPDRVRISTAGQAVLAFPAVTADAGQQSDVAGLGAALYALLTNRWPLRPEGGESGSHTVGGMALAPRENDGVVAAPRSLRGAVPFELSAVTVRALQPASGIRTAAAVQTVLEQASVLDQQTDTFAAVRDDEPYSPPRRYEAERTPPGGVPYDDGADPDDEPRPHKRSGRLVAAFVVLAVLAVVILGYIGSSFANLFDTGQNAPLPSLSEPSSTAPGASSAPAPAAAAPVALTGAAVYSPGGDLDNSSSVGNTIDGDQATTWSSDNYQQPFGPNGLKEGLGVQVTLAQPARPTLVSIDSPSAGTVVEIRTAPSLNPPLSSTQVLATATLQAGRTDIPVTTADPTSNVIVWITTLAKRGSGNESSIGEITVTAAP
ncbi:hypothetical protein GCM10027047_05310 [Rhodococcus aerolatus]